MCKCSVISRAAGAPRLNQRRHQIPNQNAFKLITVSHHQISTNAAECYFAEPLPEAESHFRYLGFNASVIKQDQREELATQATTSLLTFEYALSPCMRMGGSRLLPGWWNLVSNGWMVEFVSLEIKITICSFGASHLYGASYIHSGSNRGSSAVLRFFRRKLPVGINPRWFAEALEVPGLGSKLY